MSIQKILNRENRTIVYEYEPKQKRACIVYLHGLNSSRQSEKGKRLLKLAKEKNYAFLSVDYTAHGESEGTPADFRVARCLNDVLDVMAKEKIVNPPVRQVLIFWNGFGKKCYRKALNCC